MRRSNMTFFLSTMYLCRLRMIRLLVWLSHFAVSLLPILTNDTRGDRKAKKRVKPSTAVERLVCAGLKEVLGLQSVHEAKSARGEPTDTDGDTVMELYLLRFGLGDLIQRLNAVECGVVAKYIKTNLLDWTPEYKSIVDAGEVEGEPLYHTETATGAGQAVVVAVRQGLVSQTKRVPVAYFTKEVRETETKTKKPKAKASKPTKSRAELRREKEREREREVAESLTQTLGKLQEDDEEEEEEYHSASEGEGEGEGEGRASLTDSQTSLGRDRHRDRDSGMGDVDMGGEESDEEEEEEDYHGTLAHFV
ncbi:hypothetical protein KIPB_006918 [Kipferlia bialata]|uniref:Uncharacterized protein n=1 Tax=Kipferlia bialata TaxID=797122 RepID=A0A9K3D0Z0_9EUKA|nr:hypothetical protein KIPB_006918 [Kipferlia bialata]|eukprot:g6918.t1